MVAPPETCKHSYLADNRENVIYPETWVKGDMIQIFTRRLKGVFAYTTAFTSQID
jgi:hypothetical protein